MTKARMDREVAQLRRIAVIAKECGHSNDQAGEDFGGLIGYILEDAMRAYDLHQEALAVEAAPKCGGCGKPLPNWPQEKFMCNAGGYATCFPNSRVK